MAGVDYVEPVIRGRAVLGYRPIQGGRLYGIEGRAASRVRHLAELASLRSENGEWSALPVGWVQVLADALAVLHGRGRWRLDERSIRARLPRADEQAVSSKMIRDVIATPRSQGRLLSESAAGHLVNLTLAELAELAERGVILSMKPADETPADRVRRREERRRKMHRDQMRRLRKQKKDQALGNVTPNVADIASGCDVRMYSHATSQGGAISEIQTEEERVAVAVARGAATPSDIARATHLPLTTLRPLLSRLLKAGRLKRPSRGRYVTAEAPT